MLDLRAFGVAGMISAAAALSCTPDTFSYDEPGGGGPADQIDCDEGPTCVPECPPGTARNAQGNCEETCGPWQLTLDFPAPEGLTASDDRLFAIGTSAADDGRPEQAQLTPMDACHGVRADSVLPLGSESSVAGGVGALGGSVFTAGTATTGGQAELLVVELEAATLVKKSSVALTGLPPTPLARGVAAGSDGVWVVGRGGPLGGYVPWLSRATAAGTCTITLPGSGEANAVGALSDGAVALIGRGGGALGFVRVDAASCAPPACGCAPASSVDVTPVTGATGVSPNAVAIRERTALVVGHAQVGSETLGFVASIDADSGALETSTTWDVAAGVDGLLAAAESGGTLYVGGLAGAKSVTELSTGHAALGAFSLPLVQGALPIWSLELEQIQRLEGVLASPSDGVFALGALPAKGSQVIHCRSDGC